MAKRKKKSALKSTVRDIGIFSTGATIVGASGVATGVVGHGAAAGVAGMSTMMPAAGRLVVTKGVVGMLAETTGQFKPKKRKRKYK